jgi:hypothetical protein
MSNHLDAVFVNADSSSAAYQGLAAKFAALSGVKDEHFNTCVATLDKVASLAGAEKDNAIAFMTSNCGKAVEFSQASSHFKYMVQWMMWPATAMMIAAAITSVLIPVVRSMADSKKVKKMVEEPRGVPQVPRPHGPTPQPWP